MSPKGTYFKNFHGPRTGSLHRVAPSFMCVFPLYGYYYSFESIAADS